jgi:hypothetical protein
MCTAYDGRKYPHARGGANIAFAGVPFNEFLLQSGRSGKGGSGGQVFGARSGGGAGRSRKMIREAAAYCGAQHPILCRSSASLLCMAQGQHNCTHAKPYFISQPGKPPRHRRSSFSRKQLAQESKRQMPGLSRLYCVSAEDINGQGHVNPRVVVSCERTRAWSLGFWNMSLHGAGFPGQQQQQR